MLATSIPDHESHDDMTHRVLLVTEGIRYGSAEIIMHNSVSSSGGIVGACVAAGLVITDRKTFL